MKNYLALIFILFTYNAYATSYGDSGGWINRDGSPVKNTDNMKSIGGFGGWLIITPDKDWVKKWETPADTTPQFSEAENVHYGEELTILPFYINPKLNDKGEAHVLCNIQITKPNGIDSINQKNIPCVTGKLQGSPRNVRLTSMVIKYVGEKNDLPGTWLVKVTLIDKIRNISIPLKSKFKLIKNG